MVTGANSGIGKALCTQLASVGATVIMVCRNLANGEKARQDVVKLTGNPFVEVSAVELSSLESVRALASAFRDRHDRLHLLMNNAAVVEGKRIVTLDGFEEVFQVNYLSHFLLTLLLLDVLKKSAPSRVVNVVSSVHTHIDFDDLQEERGYNAVRSYGQSKLAQIMFTFELARRLQNTSVTVNCVHPGAVRTHLGDEGGIVGLGIKLIRPFVMSPEKAARALVLVATSPALENVSGKYFFKDKIKESSKESRNEEEAKRLWDVSLELTGLSKAKIDQELSNS
jgi:NAD(P)-dependent dehydrogenase (short-subunit alcohol dehydrogenase family)